MMQGLEVASEEADHLLHVASERAYSVPAPATPVDRNGKSSCFSIHQKLRQLYLEESAKATLQPLQYLRPTSHLLEKLVGREQLNTLLLNLYPGNKGYSLCINMGGDNSVETVKFPYQEDQLLSYIDNEELPPAVADLLEQSHPELYYSGCVIVKVIDHRQALAQPSTHHVLLRPSTQSLLNDVNMLTADGDWTAEERLALESQLVLATAGPLCLDPSPAVSLVQQRLHHRRHALNTPALRCAARRHAQIAANRKRKLDQLSTKPLSHLADFISRRKIVPTRHTLPNRQQQPSTAPKQVKKEVEGSNNDYWSDVQRFAKPLDRPVETKDCTPLLFEEYILETERGPGRVYYIKLSILQRPSNCEYLGQLYVDKEYREGESNGASCRFSLGSRAQANRYIQQFTEIFTEEGRKSVRITHVVPGQPARVICTAGMRERDAKMAALVQQQQQTLKQVLCAAMTQQQQMKLQKAVQAQKDQQTLADSSVLSNVAINGIITSAAMQNGLLANGELAASSTHTPIAVQTQQPSKPVIMTNPAISALANDLKNSAQQYQQQQQAAANAAAAAAAAANAATTSNSTNTNSQVNILNNQPTGTVTNNHHNNAAILSLLNSNSGTSAAAIANPTLNQLLSNVIPPTTTAKPQVLTTRKMTLTNIINPRSIAINPQANSTNQTQPVRVSLSSLTNQLSSPPLSQKLSTGRIVSGSVQTQTLVPAGVQYSNVQTISGSSVRRLSTATETSTPTTSLGLSMPGLSALLAGTPSADNPVPGVSNSNSALLERLSTPPSYPSSSPKPPPAPSPTSINLNLASVQGALASIPGLQNVQVSIPGLAVPISMSINNSSPHIVTSLPVTASLPVSIMTTTNLAAVTVSGNSPTAALVFTNASPVTAQLLPQAKGQATTQTLRNTVTPTTCNIAGQSIQLVGTLQRPRNVVATATNKPTLMARQGMNNQRHTLKVSPTNTVVRATDMSSTSGQVLALSPHQQIQIQALQKQAQLQLQQFPTTQKHRRRPTADNK